ncbi:MAG: Ig-like domain-containing protein [Mucilaginibacter sp.]
MTLNKKWPKTVQLLLLFVVLLLAFGCAVPQKPQGGPRDILPPKLLLATPANQTRNFTGKQIKLDFDEYFKLNNPYQEITISPTQEGTPDYRIKQKSLIITLRDTLQKNTTYVINFGKAVLDVNEGNQLKNFTYVFSTGPYIDSLSISGNVTNDFSLDKQKDVSVLLFTQKQDSLLFGKKKPPIFTSTDTSGNFTLGNLHSGTYKLYALKETTPDRIYNNENELIGFPTKTITLTKDTSGVNLHLFKQVPVKFRLIDHRFDVDGKILLTFNRRLEKPALRIISSSALNDQKFVEFTPTKDTAYVYMRSMDFDSLKIAVLDNNKPLDTATLRKGRKETFVHTIAMYTNADAGNLIKPGNNLEILTNTPLTAVLKSLITLKQDSTIVTNFTILRDTGNTKRFSIRYPWRQNATYLLTFSEGALTGFFGEKNKVANKRFSLDKPDNYSLLTLKISVPDTARSYIVELLNETANVLRTDVIKKNASLDYRNYLVGKYKVRVTYDTNRNGKWDSGSLKENRQPEHVWIDPKLMTLRPNFDIEETVDIPPEPTP